MSCEDSVINEPVVIGSTYYWEITAYKDGVVWDITGATITHYFMTPNEEIKSASMAVSDGPAGIAFHVNTTDIFDEIGGWSHSYKIVLSGLVIESKPEEFTVYQSLASLS